VKTWVCILSIIFGVTVCHAGPALFSESQHPENVWIKKKHEGWYFYNEPDEEPEPEEPPPPPPPQPNPQPQQAKAPESPEQPKPRPLTVEWFRKHYDEVLNRAVDNPTPENVKAYLFLQRVIMDKSTNFAYAVRNAVYTEPLLDENTRIPLASAMRAAMLKMRDDNAEQAFRHLAGKAGLWFIFNSKCQFCEWQYPQVKTFADKYGFRVIPISQDGATIPAIPAEQVLPDLGQSQKLGIRVVPALALVVPERQEIIVVSQGALSLEGIQQRVMTAVLERHLLPKDMEDSVDIFRRGILTPEQIAQAPDDPVQLINYIRTELEQNWTGGPDASQNPQNAR